MRVWDKIRTQVKGFTRSIKGFALLFVMGLSFSLVALSNTNPSFAIKSDSQLIAQNKNVEITLVSFAVTKAAHDAIIPKFVQKWKKETGQNVTFKKSYGGSGSQTRAVIDGLQADVVHLALAADTNKITQAGLINPGWEKEVPNNGIVSKSVAAIVTRAGNPKGIKNWSDLGKSGVKVITADPKTSGVARWNFLALWNAGLKSGGESKALQLVTNVYKNVPILAKDAREATDIFYKQGQGDALINYENEILLADQRIADLPYIIPSVNISIDNPIAVVDKNVDKHGNRKVAEAFVKYLFTPEAQKEFAKIGFRPVNSAVAGEFASKYPRINQLATIQDFGGWDAVQKKFFAAGGTFDRIQSQIKR